MLFDISVAHRGSYAQADPSTGEKTNDNKRRHSESVQSESSSVSSSPKRVANSSSSNCINIDTDDVNDGICAATVNESNSKLSSTSSSSSNIDLIAFNQSLTLKYKGFTFLSQEYEKYCTHMYVDNPYLSEDGDVLHLIMRGGSNEFATVATKGKDACLFVETGLQLTYPVGTVVGVQAPNKSLLK
jgi:hypothetical protein